MKNQYTYEGRQIKNVLLLIAGFLISLCAFAQSNTWTWMHGSNTYYGASSYGTQGLAAPSNTPASLYEAAQWTDMSGHFWIFGGLEQSSAENAALWTFDPSTNMWTWVKGNPNSPYGVYGNRGVSSPANFPGSRGYGSATWADSLGNLWLFGGWGYDQGGQYGPLSDLWKYNIASNEWTWMSGWPMVYHPGHYGTMLVPDTANFPACRQECIANWVDQSGNFWLYGGLREYDSNSSIYFGYNDTWKYNPSTNEWTWVSGIPGMNNAAPNYGTIQVPSATNNPGMRCSSAKWTDQNGRFWMYGGTNFNYQVWGDMWMFDPATNLWTWMEGQTNPYASNTFTIMDVPGNGYPAATFETKSCWTDACGRFWSYGGFTFDNNSASTTTNCLWMFDPATYLFTWKGGTTSIAGPGNYGTIQVPATSNFPDGGAGICSFKDSLDNFWMFGGWNLYQVYGSTNSLWKFEPPMDSCNLTLHISEANSNAFVAYPNPANGTVFIQFPEKMPLDGISISVFDAAGRCIETKTNLSSGITEIHPEAAGLYLVTVQDKNGNQIGSARIVNTN